jgi:hypothetical protein
MKLFELKEGSGKSVYKHFCENCGCRIMTKVDLIEVSIHIDFGTFDNWNAFKPKVELWNEYKSDWIGEFECVSTVLKIMVY